MFVPNLSLFGGGRLPNENGETLSRTLLPGVAKQSSLRLLTGDRAKNGADNSIWQATPAACCPRTVLLPKGAADQRKWFIHRRDQYADDKSYETFNAMIYQVVCQHS